MPLGSGTTAHKTSEPKGVRQTEREREGRAVWGTRFPNEQGQAVGDHVNPPKAKGYSSNDVISPPLRWVITHFSPEGVLAHSSASVSQHPTDKSAQQQHPRVVPEPPSAVAHSPTSKGDLWGGGEGLKGKCY